MGFQLFRAGVGDRQRWRLKPLDLELQPRSLHAVLGPNGAGKSTLLHLLAGDLVPTTGQACLDGHPLARWSPEQLARRRVVYAQSEQLRFAYTALEAAQLGSLPWALKDNASCELAHRALQWVDGTALAHRSVLNLSGGEQARVRLARALVQLWAAPSGASRFLLLDEPTAHLDFAFQHHVMELLRRLVETGYGVLFVAHDPNLAMRYAQQVTLLSAGSLIGQGTVDIILTAERMSAAYGIEIIRDDHIIGPPALRVATGHSGLV